VALIGRVGASSGSVGRSFFSRNKAQAVLQVGIEEQGVERPSRFRSWRADVALEEGDEHGMWKLAGIVGGVEGSAQILQRLRGKPAANGRLIQNQLEQFGDRPFATPSVSSMRHSTSAHSRGLEQDLALRSFE